MAKEELLELRGQVVELLPNAMFRVRRDAEAREQLQAAGACGSEDEPHGQAALII